MPPDITTVHDLHPPSYLRTAPGQPIACRLKADPGWNVLAFEWTDGVPTKRVLFIPVACWGLVLSPRATQSPTLAKLTAAVLPPMPVQALVPIGAADQRLADLRGFILLSPPGESFTEAIARAEQESEAVRALVPETLPPAAPTEADCPRDLPCGRVGHHFDDECAPAPHASVEGGADGR